MRFGNVFLAVLTALLAVVSIPALAHEGVAAVGIRSHDSWLYWQWGVWAALAFSIPLTSLAFGLARVSSCQGLAPCKASWFAQGAALCGVLFALVWASPLRSLFEGAEDVTLGLTQSQGYSFLALSAAMGAIMFQSLAGGLKKEGFGLFWGAVWGAGFAVLFFVLMGSDFARGNLSTPVPPETPEGFAPWLLGYAVAPLLLFYPSAVFVSWCVWPAARMIVALVDKESPGDAAVDGVRRSWVAIVATFAASQGFGWLLDAAGVLTSDQAVAVAGVLSQVLALLVFIGVNYAVESVRAKRDGTDASTAQKRRSVMRRASAAYVGLAVLMTAANFIG